MRQVIVEHVGSGEIRTINVGIDWDKIVIRPNRTRSHSGILCSPRILGRLGSWDCKYHSDTKCWKTTKKGEAHARKGHQRHPDRQPSRRRNRWGRVRKHNYPSVRTLNEMGRCIYPCVDQMDYMEYTMGGQHA